MKHVLVPTGLLALAGAAGLVAEDRLTFRPDAGAKVEKTFEMTAELSLDDLRVTVNGEEQDVGDAVGEGVSLTGTMVVVDHFEAVEDGRATSLLRTYADVSGEYETSDGEAGEGSLDDLESAVVKFAWNADEERYEVSFEEGGGDEDVLDALAVDMDYSVLLPSGAVEEGDEWTVGGDAMVAVLLPGFDLRRAADAGIEVDGEEIPEELVEALQDFLSGVEGTCTFRGLSELDGATVADIGLASSFSGSLDLDPSMMGAESEFEGDMEVTVRIDLDVEGTLLWNVDAGRFASFEMEGEGEAEAHVLTAIPDFDFEIEQEILASILLEQSAKATPAE